MDESTLISALVMGVVEGLTEFIPVSSTGHLILLDDLLGFQGPPGRLFEVVIQLGAILAVCVVYFQRLLNIVVSLPSSPEARRFVLAILLAFLPAAVIGVLRPRLHQERAVLALCRVRRPDRRRHRDPV